MTDTYKINQELNYNNHKIYYDGMFHYIIINGMNIVIDLKESSNQDNLNKNIINKSYNN
jgi:hypothetical protein